MQGPHRCASGLDLAATPPPRPLPRATFFCTGTDTTSKRMLWWCTVQLRGFCTVKMQLVQGASLRPGRRVNGTRKGRGGREAEASRPAGRCGQKRRAAARLERGDAGEHVVDARRLREVVAGGVVRLLADLHGLDHAIVNEHAEPLGALGAKLAHRARVGELQAKGADKLRSRVH